MSFLNKVKGLFKKENKTPQKEQTANSMGDTPKTSDSNKSRVVSSGSADATSKIELEANQHSLLKHVEGEGQSEDDITKAINLDDLEDVK